MQSAVMEEIYQRNVNVKNVCNVMSIKISLKKSCSRFPLESQIQGLDCLKSVNLFPLLYFSPDFRV